MKRKKRPTDVKTNYGENEMIKETPSHLPTINIDNLITAGVSLSEIEEIKKNLARLQSILGIPEGWLERTPLSTKAGPSDIPRLRDRAWNHMKEHLPVERVDKLLQKLDEFSATLPPPRKRK